MISFRKKPDPFHEQFPDYPIKPVPARQKIHILLLGLGTAAGLVALGLGLFFILAQVKIPTPLIVQLQERLEPETEEEMFLSLTVDQLHPIGSTCAENKDPECARTVYRRILELNPQDHMALGSLAVAEASLGRTAEALQLMREFVQSGGREKHKKAKVTRMIDEFLKQNSSNSR